MSGLLYGVGTIAFLVGAVMVGFGVPINEFGFGNTLIGAGVTAAVGGLVVFGLGVVVSQLRRLNDVLAARTPLRPASPIDMFDKGLRNVPAGSHIPFPPKPKGEAGLRERAEAEQPHLETLASADLAASVALPAEDLNAAAPFAPTLRNPEETPVRVEDDVSPSMPHPTAAFGGRPGAVGESVAAQSSLPSVGGAALPRADDKFESKFDAGWRSPAPAGPPPSQTPTNFDSMWPAEAKPAKSPAAPESSPAGEPKLGASLPRRAETEALAQRLASEPHGVAILKSGVVDGMGYTLYVDGSIEAELPQGTLRFSSINELRSHLEKNS
jgi:hypothetical protein